MSTPSGIDGSFQAAATGVDITPDLARTPVALHGYGARGVQLAAGVHDPIHAKILVLSTGTASSVAIVTLDILQIDAAFKAAIIERTEIPALSADNLIVAAAHDHSAPAALEPRTRELPGMLHWYHEEYCDEVVGKIADGLAQAWRQLVPARFTAVSIDLPKVMRNRRVDAYDYDGRTFSAPADQSEVIDSELSVLSFADEAGDSIATLANLAGHATVLGADNMLISGDWPGYLQRAVERELSGVCLYANGAEGDVAPECGAGPLGFEHAERLGERIAARVVALVRAAEFTEPDTLGVRAIPVELPPFSLAPDSPFIQMGVAPDRPAELLGRLYPTHTQMCVFRLGDVGAVTIPGEMLTELSLEFKARARAAGISRPLLLGLANDSIGYIPSRAQYARGGYEPGMCLYGAALGSQLLDAAVPVLAGLFSS